MKLNAKLLKMIKDLCTPAYIYFIMTTLSFVSYLIIHEYAVRQNKLQLKDHLPKLSLFIKSFIFSIVWIYILNWLCKKSPTGKIVAWILVVLPILGYVIIIVGLLLLVYMSSQADERKKIKETEIPEKVNQPEQLSQDSGETVN